MDILKLASFFHKTAELHHLIAKVAQLSEILTLEASIQDSITDVLEGYKKNQLTVDDTTKSLRNTLNHIQTNEPIITEKAEEPIKSSKEFQVINIPKFSIVLTSNNKPIGKPLANRSIDQVITMVEEFIEKRNKKQDGHIYGLAIDKVGELVYVHNQWCLNFSHRQPDEPTSVVPWKEAKRRLLKKYQKRN